MSQVLMYSGTAKAGIAIPAGTIPAIYTQNAVSTGTTQANFVTVITTPQNYSASQNLVALNNALNASIATALSIVPLASPTSGIIEKKDPATGVDLPVSSTLGPIFTERAETIGKHRFYIGFSHQDYHFTKFNGTSLNSLSLLYPGGDTSKINCPTCTVPTSQNNINTVPATFNIGADIRLSQDIAFLTAGVTDRFDITVGLPMVHAAAAARMFNGTIYAGTGFTFPTCWCADTFTPGSPTLQLPEINQASQSKTGFGDLLLRFKGAVYNPKSSNGGLVVALGTDLRFPTGDEANYLGTGATSVKPFMAVSLYSKPFHNNFVISPHMDLGWQYSGKSILGSDLQPTSQSGTPALLAAPFTTATKGFLPDVLSWAVGAEVALGSRNTAIVDVLGNEIGIVHGIPNAVLQSIGNQALPSGPQGSTTATTFSTGVAQGLVRTPGLDSFHQTTLSLGYKARLIGKLVANVNFLVRLDDNGLVARFTPLYGLGYSF